MYLQTAFKKGSRDGIPRAEATTANALAVVFLTYSSMLSISVNQSGISILMCQPMRIYLVSSWRSWWPVPQPWRG